MPSKHSPLELLIAPDKDDTSTERRELMRLCTDRLLSAPDRYDIREMEYFDLLYSNTAVLMEQYCRRMLGAALKKANVPGEAIKALVFAPPSMLGQILRRSATLPLRDLVDMIRDKTVSNFGPNMVKTPADEVYLPEHRFVLPEAIASEMSRFIYLACRLEAHKRGQKQLTALFDHAFRQNGQRLAEESQIEARDAILEARGSVQKKIRARQLDEDYLIELVDTGHNLQFTLALAHMVGVDPTTMLRILNDSSWDSLALACRAATISRACFSKIINAKSNRQGDEPKSLRILGLYERIPVDVAKRTMRFWKVRVAGLRQIDCEDEPEMPPEAANTNTAETGGRKVFGQ